MERTREEQIEVANEIIRQLGGSRFTVMTGAKDYMATEKGVRFRIPGHGFTRQGINLVTINLDPSDTYTVKFDRVHGRTVKTIFEHDGFYNDQLQAIFRAETGLDCHL